MKGRLGFEVNLQLLRIHVYIVAVVIATHITAASDSAADYAASD